MGSRWVGSHPTSSGRQRVGEPLPPSPPPGRPRGLRRRWAARPPLDRPLAKVDVQPMLRSDAPDTYTAAPARRPAHHEARARDDAALVRLDAPRFTPRLRPKSSAFTIRYRLSAFRVRTSQFFQPLPVPRHRRRTGGSRQAQLLGKPSASPSRLVRARAAASSPGTSLAIARQGATGNSRVPRGTHPAASRGIPARRSRPGPTLLSPGQPPAVRAARSTSPGPSAAISQSTGHTRKPSQCSCTSTLDA